MSPVGSASLVPFQRYRGYQATELAHLIDTNARPLAPQARHRARSLRSSTLHRPLSLDRKAGASSAVQGSYTAFRGVIGIRFKTLITRSNRRIARKSAHAEQAEDVMVHNHPSGDPTEEEITVPRGFVEAA